MDLFSLILTIWLSSVGSSPLIYLPITLIKWDLKPVIMLSSIVERVGYTPLGILCNHIGIYHLPWITEQQFSNSNFIDQFIDLLTEELPKHQDLIIMGDINIHINYREDQDAQILLDTKAAFNSKQHINTQTPPRTYIGSNHHICNIWRITCSRTIHIRSQIHNIRNNPYKTKTRKENCTKIYWWNNYTIQKWIQQSTNSGKYNTQYGCQPTQQWDAPDHWENFSSLNKNNY